MFDHTLPWAVQKWLNGFRCHFGCGVRWADGTMYYVGGLDPPCTGAIFRWTRNVGQCPTWWSPCRTLVAPSVQRRKVWLTPTTTCRAVTLPKRETSWNVVGCPKVMKQSQPLVGRSSPYCGDFWRTYCCLTSFFPIVDACLRCEDIAQ